VFSQDDVKLPFTSGWQFWCCFVTVKCPTRHVPALEQGRPIIIINIIIICPAAQSRGRKKKYGKVLNSVCFSFSVYCVEGGDRIPRCSYGQALKQETIPRYPRWWLWCVEEGDRIPRCSYGQALKQETIPRYPRWWLWCVEGGDRIPRCSYGQALKQETIPRHPRWWLWCVCQSPVPAEWPRHSTCLLSLWKRGRRRVCHSTWSTWWSCVVPLDELRGAYAFIGSFLFVCQLDYAKTT